ncbi:MAG: DUF4340 domain-containing protein [Rhodospirillaceae bacterium]|nr:DUF4340 domain-containing protein [Rhodospirillaceae bacterium]MCA8932088.1 DUF4340 domain-containing protein [Rhodospirillaceae bacterium]
MTGPRSALAITVLAVAAWAWLLADGPQAQVAEATGPLLPGLADDVAEVAAVQVTRGDTAWTARRDGAEDGEGGWQLAEFGDHPATGSAVDRLLAELAALTRLGPRTALPQRYALLGLDDPGPDSDAVGVRLLDDAGEPLADLVLGDRQRTGTWLGTPGRYIRTGDGRTWLTEGSVTLPDSPVDWLVQPLATVAPARISRLELTEAGEPPLIWRRPRLGVGFALVTDAPADRLVAAGIDTDRLAGLLADFRITAARPAADLVEAEPLGTLALETFDGLRITVTAYGPARRPWLTLALTFAPLPLPTTPAGEALGLQTPDITGQEALRLRAVTAGFALAPAPGTPGLPRDWPTPVPPPADPWR